MNLTGILEVNILGKKIFVSYKYADDQVENLVMGENSTVRDYVDEFEKKLDSSDNIYKGESEGEDLSELSDDIIWEKLKDRIYDSSVTVVFSTSVTTNFVGSLRLAIPILDKNGDSVTSHSNAMVAVVLPDENGSYSYYLDIKSCCSGGCTMHRTDNLFEIIRKNKFNRTKNALKHTCENNDTIWNGTCSYIEAVKWSNFISNYQKYVNAAVERQEHIDEYNIQKEV